MLLEGAAHRVERLEAVSGDHRDDPLIPPDVAALGELPERGGGDAAGGLGEDAGRLGEQADALSDLVVGHRVHGAARAPRQVERVRPVGRIPDRKRLGDRVRLDRAAEVLAVLEGLRDRRAAGRLSAVERRQLALDQPDLAPLVEAARDLREQRAGRDRRDHAVRQLEAELLGDLERDRLRSLRVVGPHVDVDEGPVALARQLGAEPVDVVVGAAHGHQMGAVDPGREHLLLLEVGRDEHVRVEPGCRGVCRDGVGQVARRRAGDDLVAELLRLGDGDRHDPVLERVGRVGGVVLDVELADPERLGEPRRALERRQADRKAGRRRTLERQEVRVAPDRLRAGLDAPLDRGGVEAAQVVRDLERAEAALAHVASVERVGLMTFLALERLNGHCCPFPVKKPPPLL